MPRPEVDSRQAIAQLSAAAITCRDLSHNWQPWYVHRVAPAGFERGLRCQTCLAARIEHLDGYGGLLNRRYEYPDGYLLPGVGRLDADFRSQIRLSSLLGSVHDVDSLAGPKDR